MTMYSKKIKNLVSGISQQPPLLRLPEQLEEQLNGYSSETSGLMKRPPTVFVKALMDSINDTATPLVHFVNRDATERYIMYFYNKGLRIFDLEGNEKTVKIQEDADYISTDNARDDIRVITVADYTFVVNKTKTVKMSDEKSPDSFNTQGCLIHVKAGQYGRTYQILYDGAVIGSFTTPDGGSASHTKQIDTNYIASQLASSVKASKGTNVQGDEWTDAEYKDKYGTEKHGSSSVTEWEYQKAHNPQYHTVYVSSYSVDSGSSWLRIQNVDPAKITTKDGYNNNAMISVGKAVQKFSNLPASAPDGYTVKVKTASDDTDSSGSYYVKYNASDKVWEECVAPNLPVSFDASTMPHEIVRQSDGTFVFRRAEWDNRDCGDEDSNPLPSFIDRTINDIFFYRNRLGVLAGENVILSESASYFNFWMTTANDILDTDCIDVPTTTNRINILNFAVPFNESLYLFSNSTQFMLSTDTVLSPKNVALIEVTNFESSDTCRPVVAGKNMYFPVERAEFTTIKEFYRVQQVSDVKNAQDITSHVPSYIPNGVYSIVSQNNENIMLFLTDGDKTCMYVYKYLFQNENRVQASWSKWDLQGHIFGAFFLNSTLYLCINRGGKQCLEKMNFTYQTKDFTDHEPYRVYMDSKKVAETAVYDEDAQTTTFNLLKEWGVDNVDDLSRVAFVAKDGSYVEVLHDNFNKGSITVDGNYTTQDIILGVPYTFRATLSTFYMVSTDARTGTSQSMTNGRLMVRELRFNYADTGAFIVYVKSHRHLYKYVLTAERLHQYHLGEPEFATGIFRVPVQSLNTGYTAYVESDMPLPLSLIGLTWYGNFVAKTRGV